MQKRTKIVVGTVAVAALLTTGFVGYTFRDRLLVTESRANTTEYKLATEQLTEQIASDNTDNDDIQKNILLSVGTGYLNTFNNCDELPSEEEVIIAEADDNTSGISSTGSNTGNNPQTPAASSGNSGSNTQTPAAPTGNAGSNTQTPAAPTGNAGSNTQTPAAPTGNTGSGNGGSSAGGNSGSHAGQTWHPPVYEEVWVVDKEAWTEEVPVYETRYRDVCNQCGADITSDPVTHISTLGNGCSPGGYHLETYYVQVGTNTVNHEATGHREERLVKEGYWE